MDRQALALGPVELARRFHDGIRDPQYKRARQRDYGTFTVLACLITAVFLLFTIGWDYTLSSSPAPGTLPLRLLESAAVLLLAATCWKWRGTWIATIAFISVPLFVEITFIEVLEYLGRNAAVGIGGFLYFFIFVPFIGRGFSLLTNIVALALLVITPTLLHVAGFAEHLHLDAFHAYAWLVFPPVVLIFVAMEFLHWRMHTYRQELAHKAQHDELTGLPNRRHFMDIARRLQAAAPRQQVPVSVLYMDIDRFKSINDNHGHDAGDYALKAVGEIIEQTLRESDVVARLGGEEFVAWLHNTDMETARIVANRVREAVLNGRIAVNDHCEDLDLTISIGVASCPDPSHAPGMLDQLMTTADEAMYAAKQKGRNRVEAVRVETAETAG